MKKKYQHNVVAGFDYYVDNTAFSQIYFVFEQGLIFTFKVHNIRAGTRQTGMQQANSRGSGGFF